MSHEYRRIFVPYTVSFDDHDVVETRETVRMRTKQTEVNTTNATDDAVVNALINDGGGWQVVAAVPVIKSRSHKTDRQEVAMTYTWTAGVDVILFK